MWLNCDAQWKMAYAEGFRPMRFYLDPDPQELTDLRESVAAAPTEAGSDHNCITVTHARIEKTTGGEPPGILIGHWDEGELNTDRLRLPRARH